jgi:hypothetical protein
MCVSFERFILRKSTSPLCPGEGGSPEPLLRGKHVPVVRRPHRRSLSWRNRIRPSHTRLEKGYAAIDIMRGTPKASPGRTQTQADAYCRAAFCERRSSNADRHSERHWVRFAKMFSDAASRRKRAYRIASRLKALRLTHRASFEPNNEVRRRRRRRLATTGALLRKWRGSGIRLHPRRELRRP